MSKVTHKATHKATDIYATYITHIKHTLDAYTHTYTKDTSPIVQRELIQCRWYALHSKCDKTSKKKLQLNFLQVIVKGRLPFTKLSGNVSRKKNFFDSVELFEFVEFSKGKSIFAFSAVVHDVKTTVKNTNTEDRERGSFAWLSESRWILVRLYLSPKSQQFKHGEFFIENLAIL